MSRHPGLGPRDSAALARIRRVVPYLLVSLVAAILIASDTEVLHRSGFWAAHPILSNMAANAMVVLVGILIVDRYLALRERRQWQHVASIAFQDLAREIMLIVRLMAELSGEADYRDRAARPIADDMADELHKLLDSRLGDASERKETARGDRLGNLVNDPAWGHLAYSAMQERLEWGRLTISRWAPVMVTNEYLARVLTEVAELVRDVETIQSVLVKRYVDHLAASEADVAEWLAAWNPLEERCRVAHRRLVPHAYMYRVARQLAG